MRTLYIFIICCCSICVFAQNKTDSIPDINLAELGIDTANIGADTPSLVLSREIIVDTLYARTCLNQAIELIKATNYDEAYSKADTAKHIFHAAIGWQTKEVADCLHQMGRIYYILGQYDYSIPIYAKSLSIRLKILGVNHPDVATSYNNLGNSYRFQGDNDLAIEYHKNALVIRLKILGENHPDVASSYQNLGINYNDKGEYEKSIEYNEKALNLRLKMLGENHPDVASSYNSLGLNYANQGEYDKAIEYHEKALAIRLKTLGENHSYVASSYNNLGNSYSDKGECNKAIEYHEKALKIRLKTQGESHPDVATSYGNLGNVYGDKGEYDKSIEYNLKALIIDLNNFGENHPHLALTYNNLGVIYNDKGEYNKAIEYYEKSLANRLKTLGENDRDIAIFYNNIANSYEEKGEHFKAIEYHEKALAISLQKLGENHPDLALSYHNLGVSYNSQGEYDKAIKYHEKALTIRLKMLGENHPDVASSYYNLGICYNNKGDQIRAIKYFNNAISSLKYKQNDLSSVNSFQYLVYAYKSLCLVYEKLYHQTKEYNLLEKSLEYIDQAIMAMEYEKGSFTLESSQSSWQQRNQDVHENAIKIYNLIGNTKREKTGLKVFEFAEKSKAALLQAQIKAADALSFSGIPDSLTQQEHNFRIDITWREKQRQSLLDQGLSETDTNTLRISSIIFDLKNNYESLKKRFETEYPEYYRLKYDLSTVSLQYVQDTLLEPKNQALLEYFVGDSSIYLFVVRPDTMIVQEVKRDFPLEDWIEKFRLGLYGYYTADKGKRDTALFNSTVRLYADYGQKLNQKLFAPVEQWLTKQVIIVPDGPLGYVPFDALLTGKPEDPLEFKSYPYLLNKYQFSYTYSATLLKEMRDKKHHHKPTKEFAAFAPFYNGDTTLLAGMYQYDDLMRKDLQPLAYSGPEVAAASKLMRGETIAGTAATEERFTSTAGDYRILHLATHGRADNRVGDYAFLAFSEIKDSIENELLYVKDLYNLELNADLVVLSACETGIGKLQRGEGIISLARAFAYAGAKSIVTTLWEVNDKSTSELMRYFYRELKLVKDKDEALRLARQRYFDKAAPRGLHPFFWAAFVPVGDMRPVR